MSTVRRWYEPWRRGSAHRCRRLQRIRQSRWADASCTRRRGPAKRWKRRLVQLASAHLGWDVRSGPRGRRGDRSRQRRSPDPTGQDCRGAVPCAGCRRHGGSRRPAPHRGRGGAPSSDRPRARRGHRGDPRAAPRSGGDRGTVCRVRSGACAHRRVSRRRRQGAPAGHPGVGFGLMDERDARAARKKLIWRVVQILISVVLVVAIFAYAIPKIADYRSVWQAFTNMTWLELASLVVATAFNLLTYWWQNMTSIPGLGLWQAAVNNQTTTSIAITIPGGGY